MAFYDTNGEPITYTWGPYNSADHDLPPGLPSVIDGVPVTLGASVGVLTHDGRALTIDSPVVQPDFTRVEGTKTTRVRVTFWTMPDMLATGFEASQAALHEIDSYTPEGVIPKADVLIALCRLAMAAGTAPGARNQSEYRAR